MKDTCDYCRVCPCRQCRSESDGNSVPRTEANPTRSRKNIETATGGIDPHDHVHDDASGVLRAEGTDIGKRTPHGITPTDVRDLDRPDGDDLDSVRSQRDEMRRRVEDFFDRVDPANEQPVKRHQ